MAIKVFEKIPVEARALREEVFIEEQGFNEEFDEIDNVALHIVVYDGSDAVAVCRMFESGTKGTYIVGRVAVKRELRGRHIGSDMVTALEDIVRERGGDTITLHSQCTAVDFYKNLGYEEFGEIEFEEDCPHIWMKKDIKI